MVDTAKAPISLPPPRCFLYLRETKIWWCEGGGGGGGGEGGGEKVHLLTHGSTFGDHG